MQNEHATSTYIHEPHTFPARPAVFPVIRGPRWTVTRTRYNHNHIQRSNPSHRNTHEARIHKGRANTHRKTEKERVFPQNSNKYGSSQQRGLTWDVDVPSFMIGEFTPVPLSRRNVRLFHQKGPRHAQLLPGSVVEETA